MHESTTIRLGKSTHESLKTLANDDGLTLDAEVQRLIRAERQRRMGDALAAVDLDDADRAVLRTSAKSAIET
jgi:hypothetical protein